MSSRTISKEVLNLVTAEMERGEYASPNDVLLLAMAALAEQRQAVEGLRLRRSNDRYFRKEIHRSYPKKQKQASSV